MDNENKNSFENKLNRLAEVVSKLEGETLPLDQSISLYEEGQKLIKDLEAELKAAQEKVGQYTEIEGK